MKPILRFSASQPQSDLSGGVHIWYTGINFVLKILYLSNRDSPTGILSYPELANLPFTGELNARLYQDLVQNKPTLIVDMVMPDNDTIPFIDPARRQEQARRLKRFIPPPNLEQVFNFIDENYHLEAILGKVQIYRINEFRP